MKKITLLSSFLIILCPKNYTQINSQNKISKQLQTKQKVMSAKGFNSFATPFTNNEVFIQNIGQYKQDLEKHKSIGSVKYGYEGLDMPVLFAAKGLIHLQIKDEKNHYGHNEKGKLQGANDAIRRKKNEPYNVITMEWVGANPSTEIIAEDVAPDYFTYGLLSKKAKGYKKLTYKNIYPKIDIVYTFNHFRKSGFEYSIVLKDGADLSKVKMKYTGDIERLQLDNKDNLIIKSANNSISETKPESFVCEEMAIIDAKFLSTPKKKIATSFLINGNEVSFQVHGDFDTTKTLIIDPFVSSTANLTGLNAGKAADLDFDYQGNVYVSGGGTFFIQKLAKYSSTGVLLWTFSGSLMTPDWEFGRGYGGWTVEKSTGKIYLGQGINQDFGTQVIRLNTDGIYDNYTTTQNVEFKQCFKMFWNCDNGTQQLFIAGGTTTADLNFTILEPPSTILNPLNVSGIPYANRWGSQDIADVIIDPLNNNMYTIFASNGTPQLSNQILKHNYPYSSSTIIWQIPSTYSSLAEDSNKPYLDRLLTSGITGNGINALAVNSTYLFYWDGKNLKAFNKATGTAAGNALVTDLTAKMQGGIYADACNNVFVGYANGLIKAYKFDGVNFNDAAAADLVIQGFPTGSVYDLVYNSSEKILYACGDGFVSSFDISSNCSNNNIFTLNVVPDCSVNSATASLSPAAPAGSVINYSLYNGAALISSNTTGLFTNLNSGTMYTAKATINQKCSGIQVIKDFSYSSCAGLFVNTIHSSCGKNNGTITVNASYGATPYQYSKDGINFQAANVFTGLGSGNYTITVRDANSVIRTVSTMVNVSSVPQMSLSVVDATCGLSNGSVSVSAMQGVQAYQYSKDGTNFQTGNEFNALSAGSYTIYVKDAAGCVVSTGAIVNKISIPTIIATGTEVSCNSNNGIITTNGLGGLAPYQFSKDEINYQSSNIFSGLGVGTYTMSIKDASGCVAKTSITLSNVAAPAIAIKGSVVSCNSNNGTIESLASGGTMPYTFSRDGIDFQSSNLFTGLGTGTYSITVKDANGCSAISFPVNLKYASLPLINATGTSVSCSNNNGEIKAMGSAGTAPYLYTINGNDYQSSNLFTGLSAGNYIVNVKDSNNCIAVKPQNIIINLGSNSVTADAGGVHSICEGASVVIPAISNANLFSWSPAVDLNDARILQPSASPVKTTKYYLTATLGICSKTDSAIVTVQPAPVANAGADATICNGKNIQLNGSGGTDYIWLPGTYLNNTALSNPTVTKPLNTIIYSLSVKGNNGCLSLQKDDVKITVLPPPGLDIGPDTVVIANQPLQLFARDINNSMFTQYSWSPSAGLNNGLIQNPVATLQNDTRYTLTATTSEGCIGTDDITIKVVNKTEIYVPTAFTPNNDGINDFLKTIPVGIKEFKFFTIYNRWGKKVFSTNNFSSGWDGKINGIDQPVGVFVWMVEGIDIKENIIKKRGYVILMR